ncbi:4-hydroxybenzoate octaprenyltransferase [Xenorhabdus innexi]|nr:4-hydroxybenzoate octaprenyltransferase [Xenorhabdus innexi]PHM31158.1 4-hydroxybenzoate octaprenyltransferase [Xenorhabdus innexi]
MTQNKWRAYCRLMRIDRPIGVLLLLWPTYWALWIAAKGVPSLHILLVFTLGVFFMRAAGCCINDFADRKFDGHVERTKSRPLPSGDISEKECKILFGTLALISFALVLTLNKMTIALSFAGLGLAWMYPFVKRISNLPQVVLGAAYGWSIPMAFAAVSESLPLECWLLFLANIIWSVIYDTQYAMVDRDDDLKIGVKSTAVLFGRFDKLIIGILQLIMLAMLIMVGCLVNLGGMYYWTVLLAGSLFIYQQKLIFDRSREQCFQAFMNNNYVGFVLFLGILFSYV